MKIVFFGTPEFAVPSLEGLIAHADMEVVAVITQPDKRRGRGQQLMPSPVKAIATQHAISVWQPRSIKRSPETLEELRSTQADAFVVVAYGQILSQEILDMPRLGCINAHGSLLPKYRGAAPIQWSICDGELETGITTMLMDAGMDTGAMLLKKTTAIGLLENSLDLGIRLSAIAADLLIDTLQGLDQGTIQPIAQEDEKATYARLIQKEDYLLDWSKPAIALHNQIRGFYPNCVTSFRGSVLKVTATAPFGLENELLPPDWFAVAEQWRSQSPSPAQPGTVVEVVKNHGAIVQTGDGGLLLREVQLAGRRSQSGWDFVNGNRLTVGEVFGKE
ncbi:MAG: methionyl-tRNA formyltransferase [Leptolyngbyaceae cyanobacterium SL_7_1]|nr:methionyl-tRNA formyltransferase [Leptolyngbyaceae cyanobacterium SL_7_1]